MNIWENIICFMLLRFVTTQAQLSSTEKIEILDVHNKYRGEASPPASDMLRMVSSIITM